MKKYIFFFMLLLSMVLFNSCMSSQVDVKANIERQPAWGPIGYDYAAYYYLPEIDCYYDVNKSLFYYPNSGKWKSARYLPYAFRDYDLYSMYKIVINEKNPWKHHNIHYKNRTGHRDHKRQIAIRDSHDKRYRKSQNNNVEWFSKSKSQRNYTKDSHNKNSRKQNSRRK